MRRAILVGAVLPIACAHTTPPPRAHVAATPPQAASAAEAAPPVVTRPTWPDALAPAMQGRGDPHAQPIPLPRDARGQERWLVFVGTNDVAAGAWRVTRALNGETQVDALEPWPTGVRVVGGVVDAGVAYVLLESVGVLDQPAGLHGVWIDNGTQRSPFDASPLALADVQDATELAARVAHPPAFGSCERTSVALLSTLRAASASTEMLARSLAAEGADVGVVWQSTFVQHVARLDGEGSGPSPMADHALAIVRAALTTQACGADSCEAWTDTGHAVVRFAVQGGRWVVRSILEDAPVARGSTAGTPHEVERSPSTTSTESLLRSRARQVGDVIGEAPLTAEGGTIGVGWTDRSRDTPVVAVREGAVTRIFGIDAGAARAEVADARWDAAFADVDGDGRTDVVVRMTGSRTDGSPLAWTQTFLAPPASVQVTSLEPDLATSLATMDAPDVRTAARAAVSLAHGPVAHDEACRVLSAASTPAGFRRIAAPDARVLLFDEPGMPTWRPKIVPLSKIGADDVRGLGAHCAELACSPTRPYCSWSSGPDSLHAWFVGRDAQLMLAGVADYQGE